MSTAAIRRVLDSVAETDLGKRIPARLAQAYAEVEAIEKATRALSAESISDFVYKVRDRAASDAAFTGNTWHHPRVTAYAEAAHLIDSIAAQAPVEKVAPPPEPA